MLVLAEDLRRRALFAEVAAIFMKQSPPLAAAETLVKDGFQVMVYCSDDPIQARMLEDIGVVAVMPLASLIGSGMGILNPWNLKLIIEQSKVPVLVDAGVGAELRLTPHIGVFTDWRYNFTSNDRGNLGTSRAGLRFSF